ncbi:flagellar protein FlaG [Moorella naiadis]|uniref:flagellar protein FlaG n=1 Tax=Moorella naiadis (nom. illeg.) TaxID=3093670 RepID=UPI003D9C99FB
MSSLRMGEAMMMRVEGVDPLVLGQVQSQTQKPAVQDAKKISISAEGEQQQGQQGYTREDYEKAIKKLNSTTSLFDIKLKFKLDEESGQYYVLVIDAKEGKVIRRIPPENVLKIADQMQYMVGLLLDELI